MRKWITFLILVALSVATFAGLSSLMPNVAHAGSGSTGNMLLTCSTQYGRQPPATVSATGAVSYADPFFSGGWYAETHVTGYLGPVGPYCPQTIAWGSPYGMTKYRSGLAILRQTFGGWMACFNGSDTTIDTARSTSSVVANYWDTGNLGVNMALYNPAICQAANYPPGLTAVRGFVEAHMDASYSPCYNCTGQGKYGRQDFLFYA